MIFFIVLVTTLLNYQYTRVENYRKCISEKTQSSFCEDRIDSMTKGIEALKNAESSNIE